MLSTCGLGQTDGPNTAVSFINFDRKLPVAQEQSKIDSTPFNAVGEK